VSDLENKLKINQLSVNIWTEARRCLPNLRVCGEISNLILDEASRIYGEFDKNLFYDTVTSIGDIDLGLLKDELRIIYGVNEPLTPLSNFEANEKSFAFLIRDGNINSFIRNTNSRGGFNENSIEKYSELIKVVGPKLTNLLKSDCGLSRYEHKIGLDFPKENGEIYLNECKNFIIERLVAKGHKVVQNDFTVIESFRIRDVEELKGKEFNVGYIFNDKNELKMELSVISNGDNYSKSTYVNHPEYISDAFDIGKSLDLINKHILSNVNESIIWGGEKK
jgi:hypothetical protein